jgi:hypothetical protein
LQGDSLSILVDHAKDVLSALTTAKTGGQSDFDTALDEANYLVDLLRGYQEAYERCLDEHGIELPYVKKPD